MAQQDNCVQRNFLGGQELLINGWIFCVHGLEWCHRCTVDHRMSNNVQIEDELTEEQMELLTDYGLEDFADREQVKVTNLWKLLPSKKVGCLQHSRIACSSCFNFKQQILDRLPALKAKSDALIAEFNARRQQQSGSQPSHPAPPAAAAAGSS